jgi:chromosome segregation ATPase
MRRLLNESEESQQTRLRDAEDAVRNLKEERDRLEEEVAAMSRRRVRDLDELRSRNAELTRVKTSLEEEITRTRHEVDDLRARRDRVDTVATRERAELEESRALIEQLRESLTSAEASARDCEKLNQTLKQVTEETQQKYERLQRNQRTLNEDLKALQAANTRMKSNDNISPPKSSQSSVVSIDQSLVPPAGNSKVNLAYIKNVLLGFLEHKEQRQQLLPVVATLLEFKENDEQRFWRALQAK